MVGGGGEGVGDRINTFRLSLACAIRRLEASCVEVVELFFRKLAQVSLNLDTQKTENPPVYSVLDGKQTER